MTKIKFDFNTSEYENTYGKKPKGRGGWAFEICGLANQSEPIFTPSMTYTEAKDWIKKWCCENLPDYVAYVELEVCT